MDFHFNQEQQQFADALRRWVDKDYPFETRKKSSIPPPARPMRPGPPWPNWA